MQKSGEIPHGLLYLDKEIWSNYKMYLRVHLHTLVLSF